jgi:hypothetical protein
MWALRKYLQTVKKSVDPDSLLKKPSITFGQRFLEVATDQRNGIDVSQFIHGGHMHCPSDLQSVNDDAEEEEDAGVFDVLDSFAVDAPEA